MRTYGRVVVRDSHGIPVPGPNGKPLLRWVEVDTDANGYNDNVWLTTLAQVLFLNINESPFYGNWGIPAKQSVLQQLPPDFWVALTQQSFAPHFASLIVSKRSVPTPTYDINVITQQGSLLNYSLGIPT